MPMAGIWGSIFPGIPGVGVNSGSGGLAGQKPTPTHSTGCNMLKLKEGELLADLDPINQEFVLECPHPSHEAVKQLFMILCDGDRSENIEEGRLF